ncbi:MAG: Sensor histidine kinase [Myxococcales bacterium]|nr:Sensor histidine kinase [Myxococcales bacterium]
MIDETGRGSAAILIVDDVPANLLALEAVLQPLGHRTVAARSGNEALKALLDEEFAVILLDVTMPGMDGFETAQLIRDRNKTRSVPIIFLTAVQSDALFVSRAYERGAVDYLTKPFDPDVLRAKVSFFVELYLMRERVTQLAALEARQQEAESARARLREVLMQLPVAMAVTDGREHRVELTNPSFIQLGAASESVGRRLREVFPALAGDDEELDAVYRSGQPLARHERELTSAGADGIPARRFVTYSLQPFRGQDGTVVGVIVCGADVTREVLARENERRAQSERERLLGELQLALRSRDDFLMVASHELRTPLTSLQLTASSLVRQLERAGGESLPAPLLDDRLRTVKRQLDRLEQLINALLDVSRIGVGRLELELERVDAVEVVGEVLARLRDEAARQNVSLRLEAPAELTGSWDRSRLDQVVTNLVTNAIKYGHSKPVDVSISGDESDITLRVRDQGIGVAVEQQHRIFDKFERAASQRNYGGLGLGLWITRELLVLMGGVVTVESSPGNGATFTVTLPRNYAGVATASRAPSETSTH